MAQSPSKIREKAEAAFSKTQTDSLAHQRTHSEMDAETIARKEKTERLRLLREAHELAKPAPAPRAASKRAK